MQLFFAWNLAFVKREICLIFSDIELHVAKVVFFHELVVFELT